MGDWFTELVGFRETSWEDTRQRLEVAGPTLRSTVNGRTFGIGTLETLSVSELRARAGASINQLHGTPSFTTIVGEVGALHREPANAGALTSDSCATARRIASGKAHGLAATRPAAQTTALDISKIAPRGQRTRGWFSGPDPF
jgi:hypothetical protein